MTKKSSPPPAPQTNVRLTPDEHKMVDEIGDHLGLPSRNAVVRYCLRQVYYKVRRERHGDTK